MINACYGNILREKLLGKAISFNTIYLKKKTLSVPASKSSHKRLITVSYLSFMILGKRYFPFKAEVGNLAQLNTGAQKQTLFRCEMS